MWIGLLQISNINTKKYTSVTGVHYGKNEASFILLDSVQLHSIPFHSILFHSILCQSIPLYSTQFLAGSSLEYESYENAFTFAILAKRHSTKTHTTGDRPYKVCTDVNKHNGM